MIVLDTSALVAILQSEPEGARFFEVISSAEQIVIAAPTKFETLMVAARHPTGQADIRSFLAATGTEVVDWTDSLAEIAAQAFLRYGKARHKAALNFGDCMSYALAKSLDIPLLFKGEDFSKTDIRSAI